MKEESRRQGLDIKKIFSESPSEEQWKRLLTYTYPNNIERYFRKNGYDQFSSELIETIAGSISQAKEYFDASKVTSLNISPLLLYYGTSNLYYDISGLLNCELFDIKNHGMTIKKPETSLRIGDIQIKPTNKKEGALSKFSEIFDCNLDICKTGTWDVIELFASIPEILEDFMGCYEKEPNVIPVSVVKDRKGTVERINPQYIQQFKDKINILDKVYNFKEDYLRPQETTKYIILRPKMHHEEIGINSVSGQKFLEITHLKNGKPIKLPIEITMFMALFSLSYISRYNPEFWNLFVRTDISGEKLLIENFLYYCHRLIPNFALNILFDEKICFINEMQGITDCSANLTKEEVEEISKSEIQKALEIERMNLR